MLYGASSGRRSSDPPVVVAFCYVPRFGPVAVAKQGVWAFLAADLARERGREATVVMTGLAGGSSGMNPMSWARRLTYRRFPHWQHNARL